MKSHQLAGMLSGATGLVVFLAIHHVWILPIWEVIPLGLIIAGLGGLAVGRAYDLLRPSLLPRPWTSLAVFLLVALILGPSILLTLVRPPLFDVATGDLLPHVTVGNVVVRFIFELLVLSTAAGALVGWLLGRTRQATLATALAGFVFALGPGHNVPFFAGTPGIPKGTALLLIPSLVAAIVLVEADALLQSKDASALLER
jgi:hypothetical protein